MANFWVRIKSDDGGGSFAFSDSETFTERTLINENIFQCAKQKNFFEKDEFFYAIFDSENFLQSGKWKAVKDNPQGPNDFEDLTDNMAFPLKNQELFKNE